MLSGSSSPELVKQISESLAGRVARVELGPLSLSEAWQLPASPLYALLGAGAPAADIYGAAQGRLTASQVRDYWFAGGYPEPWTHASEEFRSLWHRNYIDSYLLRDISALFPNLNRDRFRQFINLLSQHSEFVATHDCPLGLVITNDERPRWLADRILAIPAASL